MTPAELWDHAQKLPANTEAERRTKISRSYYALYSYACEFGDSLDSQGLCFKKESGTHSKLSQQLTNPTVADHELQARSRSMGTFQRLAHELRVKADYDLCGAVTNEDVRKCLGFVNKGLAIPMPVRNAA